MCKTAQYVCRERERDRLLFDVPPIRTWRVIRSAEAKSGLASAALKGLRPMRALLLSLSLAKRKSLRQLAFSRSGPLTMREPPACKRGYIVTRAFLLSLSLSFFWREWLSLSKQTRGRALLLVEPTKEKNKKKKRQISFHAGRNLSCLPLSLLTHSLPNDPGWRRHLRKQSRADRR